MSNKKLFITAGIIVVVVGSAILFYGKTLNSIEEQAIPVQKQVQPSKAAGTQQEYSLADVSKHNSQSDCWLVIENNVYDVTSFIPSHPGGKEILKGCGKDATSLFQGEHEHQENNAASYLPTYLIGVIK